MGERFDEAISSISNFVATHTPEILTGIGIGGMVTAGVWAVRITPKVQEELKEEARKQGIESLSAWEKFKIGFKYYAWPVITGGLAAGALISSTSISTKRNAALATAYAVSESTLKNYSRKVVETIGERKEKDIREKIVQDEIDEVEAQHKKIIDTKNGKTKCILMWNRVEFYSDIDKIKTAIAKLNENLAYDNEVTLNDLYSALNLFELDTCAEGNMLGWDISHGRIECMYSSHLGSDGIPMLAITFTNPPRPLGMPYN